MDGKLTSLFKILRAGGVLREHGVKLVGDYVNLDDDPEYPDTASVRSLSGERARHAYAGGPSGSVAGLVRLEIAGEA